MTKHRVARAIGATLLTVSLGAGAYLTLDAFDVVPGYFTVASVVPEPQPFPTAPAIVLGGTPGFGLTSLDPAAPIPNPAAVGSLVTKLITDPRLGPATSVLVIDVLTGEVLGGANATTPLTPASTAKLLTAFAALTSMSLESTLPTRVVSPGPGQIVLVGGGDIMLAAGAGDPTATNGRAGLADLAQLTAAALADETTVQLLLDDTYFTGPVAAPLSHPDNIPAGYIAPVQALAVNIGKVEEGVAPPRWPDPALHAAETFAAALAAEGVSVTGQIERTTAPGEATELARVESAPLVDIVEYFMHTSDNTVTEAVCRVVAARTGHEASFDGGTAAVLAAAESHGIDISGARLSDCSGLADESTLTATTLGQVLTAGLDPARPELRALVNSLPIAALEGTVAERYTESEGAGTVRAKTGSLPGVTSLAGTVLDLDGRQLVFVVIANDTAGGSIGARAAIDEFVAALAGCGCG